MSLSISQISAASFPAILAEKKKPANQWAESALLHYMEKYGMIEKKGLGPTIEAPLDFQPNPGTVVQTSDLQALSMEKTEVLTSASYTPAEVTVPVVFSKKDEAMNPSENQKIAFATALNENAIESHDDKLEQIFFVASTNGFLGLPTHVTYAQTGSSGGIDPASNTWWKNQKQTYTNDTDIEAALTTCWNQCAKGTGAKVVPTLLVSDAPTQSLFEGTQQPLQRYESQDLKAGFKTIMFKTATWVFSQYAGNSGAVYLLNNKALKLVVSSMYFRDFSAPVEIPNANGFVGKIYSALQLVGYNRSRLGIVGTSASV